MLSISRSIIRAQPGVAVFSSNFGRKSTGRGVVVVYRVQQRGVAGGKNRPEGEAEAGGEMDRDAGKLDTMSCFGEAYATRSDEEGFGGIYGGNQDVFPKKDKKEKVSINTDHEQEQLDKQQGSEVKEKEKSRHQNDPSS